MLEQHSTSKITCDTESCGANERRSGLVDMRARVSFLAWTYTDGKDFCPRCSLEARTPKEQS